ncbi:MAG: hypothetical protein M1816_007583 [Peltula sp. TS41687]|nr:MAG: hypothetical protein M1816_007583 [Peltula sp. TS41687]
MSANAVDEVSAALANTTIADTTDASANQNKFNGTTKENDASMASAAEGRRLYIGNLAYATTEGELKEFFKDFLVESTSIPSNPRNGRPVGYAFVDLSTPAEAERAINELSGKEILQRKVSVQLARKHDPAGDRGESGGENGSGGEGEGRRYSGRGRFRGRGRGRFRGGRFMRNNRGRQNENTDDAQDGGQDGGAEGTTNGEPTNLPAQVIPLTEKTNEAQPAKDGGNQGSNNTSGKPGGTGPRRQRGPPEDGIVSKTKVMVANLPYNLHEDKLKELFKEYEPVAAKIALRPIPRFMVRKLQARGEPRKGRGFGFVTLASEELQQKAISEMNGKEIEGREIAVKVAIDSPGKEDNDGNEQADESAGNEENTEQQTEQAATN